MKTSAKILLLPLLPFPGNISPWIHKFCYLFSVSEPVPIFSDRFCANYISTGVLLLYNSPGSDFHFLSHIPSSKRWRNRVNGSSCKIFYYFFLIVVREIKYIKIQFQCHYEIMLTNWNQYNRTWSSMAFFTHNLFTQNCWQRFSYRKKQFNNWNKQIWRYLTLFLRYVDNSGMQCKTHLSLWEGLALNKYSCIIWEESLPRIASVVQFFFLQHSCRFSYLYVYISWSNTQTLNVIN